MADAAALPDRPPPWGYVATAAWALLALVLAIAAAPLTVHVVILWRHGKVDRDLLGTFDWDEPSTFLVMLVATAVAIGVCALAAQFRRWSARDYFGLTLPHRRYVLIAVVFLLAIGLADHVVVDVLGVPLPQSQYDGYISAKAAGALPLWWIDYAVLAPLGEEIVFRGFLQRGWVRSDHSAIPGIVIIAALWTIIHVQYEWLHLASVFFSGLLFGWIRWRSGSTLLTIAMHVIINLEACVEITATVEKWFS
jgi:membrane protease YdiL (CAAX protease family)